MKKPVIVYEHSDILDGQCERLREMTNAGSNEKSIDNVVDSMSIWDIRDIIKEGDSYISSMDPKKFDKTKAGNALKKYKLAGKLLEEKPNHVLNKFYLLKTFDLILNWFYSGQITRKETHVDFLRFSSEYDKDVDKYNRSLN